MAMSGRLLVGERARGWHRLRALHADGAGWGSAAASRRRLRNHLVGARRARNGAARAGRCYTISPELKGRFKKIFFFLPAHRPPRMIIP